MHSRTLGTLGLLMLLTLSGCSSWFDGGTREPEVRLVRVELIKARLVQQKFRLHFRVDNPNDDSLTVRSLHYRLYLDGWLLSEGESETGWFTVEANSHASLVIPVRTNLWEHLRDLTKRLKHPHDPIPYRLEGELETGLFLSHDVHLERKGEIIPAEIIPE
ncbi:LEA type 2 family protein [Pseudomonas sp. MWU12-2037]|uniref:LEA type 2 family protein n=1 Tax=Pseudomonas sp. MWU12-2037 TaxID=2928690 RepID=UPI00200ECEAE|nr:LEA type 2 family protein [Pseudomonas sp. MWU12-2037]